MKIRKYSMAALGIITILLVTAWFLRNAIIQRISNPLLEQYDVKVTDVSLDALATSNASISYLEVEHVNGTVVAIEDLTLPIATSANGFKTYSAEKISVELPPSDDDAVPELARILRQLLMLPARLPDTEVMVTELITSPYPAMHEVRWESAGDDQQLTAHIASIALTAKIDRVDETNHALNISIVDADGGTPEQTIAVDIQQSDASVTMNGTSTLDLPLWMPVITTFGQDKLDLRSGSATLRFDADFLHDMTRLPAVYADFTPTTPIELTYAVAPGALASVKIESSGQFEITASIPDFEWVFRQAEAALLVSFDEWQDVQVSLINVSCQFVQSQFTRACQGNVGILMENAELPFATVERLEISAEQTSNFGEDQIEVLIKPDATISMTGIADPSLEIAGVDALLSTGAILTIVNNGWQATAQSADLTIDEYSVVDGLTFSASAFLDDVSLGELDEQPIVKAGVYASSSQARQGGQLIRLPGIKGNVARQGTEVAVSMKTDGLHAEARIEASHNLDSEIGRLSLVNAGVSFSAQQLSDRVSPWPHDWNISAGTITIDLQAGWEKQDTEWQIAGQSTITFVDLAGVYDDTVFAGLSTSVQSKFDTATGVVVQPSSIDVALIDVGLPVEYLTAGYTLHPNDRSVEVENLRMAAFGGVITADPFSFSTESARNTLLLHANSIDLAEILSIREFESVEVSGSIGAELPVTIEGKNVTVVGGTLTGEAPGGVIRYLPGLSTDEADLSALGLATRALSNFEYETLTSEVEYSTDGDLNLQMHLSGRNPDLEDNRPVVLNLGVENNIPQMLRSLQAARAVEEILEKRLAQ